MKSLKEILMPNWKNVLLCIVILGLSLLYSQTMNVETAGRGLPLTMLTTNYGIPPGGMQVDAVGLVTDVIVWYLISAVALSMIVKK